MQWRCEFPTARILRPPQPRLLMAFDLGRFSDRYPVHWHVTWAEKLRRVEHTRQLESAAALMRLAGEQTWLRRRRTGPVSLALDGDTVQLRDQVPLAQAQYPSGTA